VGRIAIVGGGISGLSAAWYLAKAGRPSILFDRMARRGGVITTQTVEGCVIEGGPDSFLAAKPWAAELIGELGLSGELIASNDRQRVTYIWKGGRMVPLPDGLMMMVPTRIWPMVTTSLLGWPAKIRMGLEYFRTAAKPQCDRSVSDFVNDHYGPEAVDYLAEPLLAGVYGGDPWQLSVNSVLTRFVELESQYGSLTRGVLAERRKAKNNRAAPLFQTLKGGLGVLVEVLERKLEGRCDFRQAEVEAVARSANGWLLRAGGESVAVDQLVLACPAHETALLLTGADAELSRLLASIPYSSSMTVALGYRKEEIKHRLNGFGFLVPKKDRKRMVACTWVGRKFSHRVPDQLVLLRCFLGGADDEQILGEADETVLQLLRDELTEMMGITAPPLFHTIHRWARSMAQYTVGHQRRLELIEARRKLLPGLHLAGNAYSGIGIPDCIRTGKAAAEAVAGFSAPVT